MTQITMKANAVDPAIGEAVQSIRNRFGTQGLCDLIAVAHEALEEAEQAESELSETP